MSQPPDPFHHHPELRDRIACAETSFFRGFTVERLLQDHPELEKFLPLIYSDDTREALRRQALAGHQGDLWIFAYGSLMWDPALRFQEVRRAHAPGHARRFILKDDSGGRGSEDAPGLMAALDTGAGCNGLAYRISAADIDVETEILFRRELIAPAYHAGFVPVEMDGRQRMALSFLANHDNADIVPDVSRTDQIRWIATGEGFLGTSRDYLAGIVTQLSRLGVEDHVCRALLEEVDAFRAAAAQPALRT